MAKTKLNPTITFGNPEKKIQDLIKSKKVSFLDLFRASVGTERQKECYKIYRDNFNILSGIEYLNTLYLMYPNSLNPDTLSEDFQDNILEAMQEIGDEELYQSGHLIMDNLISGLRKGVFKNVDDPVNEIKKIVELYGRKYLNARYIG